MTNPTHNADSERQNPTPGPGIAHDFHCTHSPCRCPNGSADTFRCDVPCPACGAPFVLGYILVTEDGVHQHTKYVCTRWNSGAFTPCGWAGWTVPGWEALHNDGPDG